MSKRQIVQMLPAVGWQAVYVEDDGKPFVCDLVCWALIEDEDGDRDIFPMDADSSGLVEEVSETGNFAGLKGPSQGDELIQAMVTDYLKRKAEKAGVTQLKGTH